MRLRESTRMDGETDMVFFLPACHAKQNEKTCDAAHQTLTCTALEPGRREISRFTHTS